SQIVQASLAPQPDEAEKKRQPDMRQRQVFQALVGQLGAAPVGREHEPGGRIEQSGLRVSREAQSAIDGGIPLRKVPVAQRLKRVVGERVVKTLEVERDVYAAMEWRVVDKDRDREHE